MIREFLIAGSNWIAEVSVNEEDVHDTDIKIEAATRAVEAILGRRNDIELYEYNGVLGKEGKKMEDLEKTLMELVRDEIEVGCGIGCLLVITEKNDEEFYFMSSKVVFENGGFGELVRKFDIKFPDKKVRPA